MSQEKQTTSPAPRRRKRRRSASSSFGFALFYVVFVIGVSVILACVGWTMANDVLALNKAEHSATITISSTDSFDDVVDVLEENGLVQFPFLFKLFASFTGGAEGMSRGTYTLDTDMDYSALLSGISATGDTRAIVTITIPEGYTIDQIFALLDENGVATVEDLEATAANYDYNFSYLKELELGDYHRLEGYLYPDTYDFYTPHDTVYAINKMLVNMDDHFTDEMLEDAEELGYSMHEILTMASMIERETDGTDRFYISSVIHNRLNNPQYETVGCLQIDATIYYITGTEVTQYDRENLDSPYNTHINQGLPPGPIASPGLSSIMAAIYPEDTDYYYYALGDDGYHHYYERYSSFLDFLNSQEMYSN